MRPTPGTVRLTFTEAGIDMFPPTAVTRGRVVIEHPDRVVDQRFVRVYCKRASGWQAVAVYVFLTATIA
jgi:hypothetical protein